MADRKDRSYDLVISFFSETDENLVALEILLLKLCSTEYELNSCFNHAYNYKHNQRCTILMIAVLEGRLNLVQMLFKKFRKSIDLEIKGTIRYRNRLKGGITVLWAGVYIGNLDMIKLLIENGADVNTVSNYNATPLHVATDRNRLDIVKYLIEGAHGDVHRVNKGNAICLNVAGIGGNTKLIEYLLQQPKTDINHQDIDGQTALHFAVKWNKIDAIKLLLSYKVRIDIKNVQNMTPLELAAQNANEEAVNYILSIEDLVDVKEKIEALELLGASLVCNKLKRPDFDKAYQYFMQAMILRLSSGNVKTKSTKLVQLTAAYNYRTECVSIAELESIRYEPEALREEALLVHERLLLPTSSIKLIDSILNEGWEYAYEYRYDRCIYLWFHGLQLSIVNDDMNMSIEDLKERMIYICCFMQDLGEIYYEMVSIEYEIIPTKIFFESFKMAINQFRRLYRKATGTKNVSLVHAHDCFMRSILFLIYVSTKLSFKEYEQQQLHKLIQWINRLNIRTNRTRSTLLHLSCDSGTIIYLILQQDKSFFPCAATIQLLIDCGFNVNAFNRIGDTPLHILFRTMLDSTLSIVETILHIFLNTGRLHPDYINQDGKTALDCTSNTYLIELFKRKMNISLKCLCATRLNQLNVNYENCLSSDLIDFVKRHKR